MPNPIFFRHVLMNHAAVHVPAGSAYAGPGDIVSGAYAWYGLRGYTAAYSTGSNPAADLVDQAGANPITINILSDGTLDVASIATWVTANSVSTIKVTRLYDQTGGGKHVSQATLATMPVLVLGPVTGLATNRPAMVFANAQFLGRTTAFGISAQPLTMSCVAIRTSGTTDVGMMAGANGNDAEMILQAATVASIFAGGSVVSTSQTNNAWHSFHGVFNTTSSVMNVDGSSGSTGTTGSGVINNASGIWLGRDSFASSGSWWVGNINEAGIWTSGLPSGNMSSLSVNQHSYWGY
jgi:hypothetical protein